MKKIVTLLFLSLLNSADTFCQAVIRNLKGQVINEKKAPLIFANIALLDTNNKSIFQVYTDSLGQFKISYSIAGTYTLDVSYSGYKGFKSVPFELQNKDFGVITLAPSTQNLKEIVIQAKRDLITIEPNAIVYNVAKSIDAQGISAFEALRKAPGVYIDNDRSITLNGKAGTMIMIDGKQTHLSGAELIDLLKSMPSSSIKSFEMINSPSAKYDASGAAGMINIKTTKSQIKGFNGTLTSGLTYGATLKHVQDISFNYRKNKSNVFGSYNHFLGYRTYIYDSYRVQEGKMFDSHTDDTDKRMNMGSRLGFDYNINKKNTVGVLLNVASIFGGGLTQTKTNIGQGTTTVVDQVLDAENDYYHQKTMRYTANVNYKYEDTIGRIINFDLDYGTFDKGNANRQSNIYTSNLNSVLSENLYRSLNDIGIDLKGLKFDYTANLFKGKLETGAKYSDIISDNDARFYRRMPTGDIVDEGRTSTFKYTERVAATYINYKKSLGKWGLQGGLRMENTSSGGVLRYTKSGVENTEKTPRNYTDFFPSFSVSVKANENSGISLAYSRRIDRPSYPDLNPFVYLLDEVSFWQGNPDLLPQMTHRATLQYVYKSSTIIGLTYAHTDQYSARVEDPQSNNTIIFIPLNLGIQKNFALSLTQSMAVNKWWDLNFNSTVYKVHNIVALDEFRNFNLKQTAARMNLQQTFKLPNKFTAELSGSFNSKRLIGANTIARGNSQVDLGFQRKFKKDRATLRLVVNDIYKGNQSNSLQSYTGFYLKNYGYYESRQVRLNFTYRFADSTVKGPRSRNSSLENENNRAR